MNIKQASGAKRRVRPEHPLFTKKKGFLHRHADRAMTTAITPPGCPHPQAHPNAAHAGCAAAHHQGGAAREQPPAAGAASPADRVLESRLIWRQLCSFVPTLPGSGRRQNTGRGCLPDPDGKPAVQGAFCSGWLQTAARWHRCSTRGIFPLSRRAASTPRRSSAAAPADLRG